MKRSILILASALSILMYSRSEATDYYVNGNVTASGAGTSWALAFKTINEAAAASSPTNIYVAGDELPTPIVYAESTMVTVPDAVKFYGGFPPSGDPSFSDRDPSRYVTIIDGQNTLSAVVTVDDDATFQTLIDGFTITGAVHHGIKNGANSQCAFSNLIITGNGSNPATSNGAGVHCGGTGSFPVFFNCTFSSNRAITGGAVYCPGDSAFRATNCRFIGNSAISGGAVLIEPESSPSFSEILPKPLPSISSGAFASNQLRRCYFLDNEATGGDGGAVNFSGELYAVACQFIGNSATSGAGLECLFGSLLGVNLEFAFNVATGNGGAIDMSRGCYLTLVNTTAHHNHATGLGGVVYGDAMVRMHMVNVTTVENTAGNYPSFYATFSAGNCSNLGDVYLRLRNSIIWDSADDQWNIAIDAVLDSDYNDLRSGAVGTNDIDDDPRFVDAGSGNLRLMNCSPCIDAADTTWVSQDFADVDSDMMTNCGGCTGGGGEFVPDLDFRRRVNDHAATGDSGVVADSSDQCPNECDKVVDMGAYEFAFVACIAHGDMNGDAAINGLDVQNFSYCCIQPHGAEEDVCACGDFTGDGRTDIEDVPCFIELLLTGQNSCPGDNYLCEGAGAGLKDCNANGQPDANDIAYGTSLDCNKNGVPDDCDLDPEDPDGNELVSDDLNEDGIPDECQPDCDRDGVVDDYAIAEALVADVNENGVPDPCEPDCNGNDVPDDHDVATSASDDCNENGVPDECEEDCNGNDVPDDCDIADSTSEDCNENGIPDECDLSRSMLASFDCNGNDIPDECDIASSTSEDCNENGIPDECDIANSISADENENDIPDECEEESFMFGGGNFMMGGEGGGEFDADAAWATFYDWLDQQVFGTPGDWHTLTGPQRFERVMDELRILGLPLAAPW